MLATDQWLHQLWEHTSEAMALSDADGIVLAANPAYYRLYGYAPDEVLGKSFALIFPPDQREWAEAEYQAVFHSDDSPRPVQSTVTSKNGLERVVESRVSFLEKNGRRTAMLSILRDVTEEVKAQGAAARAEQDLRTLLFSLSHDVKSPLAVVKGHAQMLRRYALRRSAAPPLAELTESLAQIEASAQRVAALVDELVEVATLEEGDSLPLRVSLIDLVAVVRQSIERHRRLADQHQIVLDTATESFAGFWDEARLARVLDNLLGNAMKYSPAGGLITVRIRPAVAEPERRGVGKPERESGCRCPGVLVSVEDHGIGIDERDLPHVFSRFRRGSNVPDHVIGSGIGLTSVEQIVHQHGGTVDIASRLGSGTLVSLWLPVGRMEPSDAPL
ncbi:MAG: PAS domain S-box protein [Chloroflexi bacterium]|nr:PAS domain S-box protein [Chloroflexota bacterium]